MDSITKMLDNLITGTAQDIAQAFADKANAAGGNSKAKDVGMMSSNEDVLRCHVETRRQMLATMNRGVRHVEVDKPFGFRKKDVQKKDVQKNSKPWRDLNKVAITSLSLGATHRGKVLLGTVVTQSFVMTAIYTVLEDANGDFVKVFINGFIPEKLSLVQQFEVAEDLFPVGARIAIREPFFKLCLDMKYAIRVDDPTDVSFIDDDVSAVFESRDPHKLLANGKHHMELGHLQDAVEALRGAITQAGDVAALKAILKNISFVSLKAGRPVAAIASAVAAVVLDGSDAKAHYRLGSALEAHTGLDEHVQVHLRRAKETGNNNVGSIAVDVTLAVPFEFSPASMLDENCPAHPCQTPYAWKACGSTSFSSGKMEEALACYRSGVGAVAHIALVVEALITIALCHDQLGQHADSLSTAAVALYLLSQCPALDTATALEHLCSAQRVIVLSLIGLGALDRAEEAVRARCALTMPDGYDAHLKKLMELDARISILKQAKHGWSNNDTDTFKDFNGPPQSAESDFEDMATLETMVRNNEQQAMREARNKPSVVREMREMGCCLKRVPPFHLEFEAAVQEWPIGVDIVKCKRALQLQYEAARVPDMHRMILGRDVRDGVGALKEQYDIWLQQRFGSSIQSHTYMEEFSAASEEMEVLFGPRYPYNNRICHSFGNTPIRRQVLTRGTVHVAVGFNDLSELLVCDIRGEHGAVHWVGYDLSEYALAKSMVIKAMLLSKDAQPESILQVWYSSTWSRDTLRAFRSALDSLLGTDKAAEHGPLVQSLLEHWHVASVPIGTAHREWMRIHTHYWSTIGGFKRKEDRIALSQYFLTGSLLASGSDVGSVVMFSIPPAIGEIALNESVFQCVDISDLIETVRFDSIDIVSACATVLVKRIATLQERMQSRTVDVRMVLQCVFPDLPWVSATIKDLGPYTISWSNVCDYVSSEEFFAMARACSIDDTVHHVYSMNWMKDVKGAFVIDYPSAERRKRFIDTIPPAMKDMLGELTTTFIVWPPIEPIDNVMNVVDYGLRQRCRSKWCEYFFKLAKLDSEQAIVTGWESYSPLSRASATAYMMFTFDSKVILKKRQDV